jgi:hypothetical protein
MLITWTIKDCYSPTKRIVIYFMFFSENITIISIRRLAQSIVLYGGDCEPPLWLRHSVFKHLLRDIRNSKEWAEFAQFVRLEMRYFLDFFCSSTNFTLLQMDRQFPPESVTNKSNFLCSDDRASSISKWRWDQLDAASDLLIINWSSTCFGSIYAHRQEVGLPFTAYGFLSCYSCCDAGESGGKMCAL